jgi:4-amino-4-deoxy-L-arabinose transferase-like glycosyltransferase
MTQIASSEQKSPSLKKPWVYWVSLFVILIFGLSLRLVDLTDPPLDFHPTRQLRSAIIARGMYYQMLPSADATLRETAMGLQAKQESYEPPIFERLTALTYLAMGGEVLWVARVYSILFWCFGGLALFDLARRMVSWGGGLVSLAYYLLIPFAVEASRSFQPDPLVTFLILLSLWSAYRWSESRTWRWAIITGLCAGLTLLVKVTAVFFVAPALILVVFNIWGFRLALRRWEVWVAAGLATLIPSSYYLAQIGRSSASYFAFWSGSFSTLWLEARFYFDWLNILDRLFNLALIVSGVVGVALFPAKSQRLFILGMWLGYGCYGLFFPFQIRTHEYYSLMFVPVVALSLAPLANLILQALRVQPRFWRLVSAAALLIGTAYPVWLAYTGMIGMDYHNEASAWIKMGQELPQDGQIVALTHDYGLRIGYYGWRFVQVWPGSVDFEMLSRRVGGNGGDPDDFEQLFLDKTSGMDYFLITRFDELDVQPLLKARLYEQYPVATEGDGYLIFDLNHPLTP